MPFQSKGQFAAAKQLQQQLNQWLMQHSEQGRIAVFCDSSPCSLTLRQALDPSLQLFDSIDFIYDKVLPKLKLDKQAAPLALHISCSAQQLGQGRKLTELAGACTEQLVIPEGISCCGFAGDKGFFLPELNASALSDLARQVSKCSRGVSSSRTCEIGLSRHSGVEYQHLLYLLDAQSD